MSYIKDSVEMSLALLKRVSGLSVDSAEAKRYLYAIGYQESGFRRRRQMGGGPARGFWQFERTGVEAVYLKYIDRDWFLDILSMLIVEADIDAVYEALQYHDTLACILARLLLWSDPTPLPDLTNHYLSFKVYLRNWRPGKPRPERWQSSVEFALEIERG